MKITSIETFIAGSRTGATTCSCGSRPTRGIHGHRRGVLMRPGRCDGRCGRRLRDLAGRAGPTRRRGALAPDVRGLALPRRLDPERGAQRHRARALGHQGQGAGRAGLAAARRPVPRPDPRLPGAARQRRPRSWPQTPCALIERYGYTALKIGPQPPDCAEDAVERRRARGGEAAWRPCARPWARTSTSASTRTRASSSRSARWRWRRR